jgi:hypothetical protein
MGVMRLEPDDDRLPRDLEEAARSYHTPPQAPRAEMWAAIEAARRRRRTVRRVARQLRWGLALAATLVLGIALGRIVGHPHASAVAPFAAAGSRGVAPDAAYRVATAQFLAHSDALLTDFRAESRKGRVDAQFLASARDLLTTTRLMLDSPAARDPHLSALLQDLELVLAQISQLPAEPHQKSEIDLINQGLTERGVLTRLRAATPASGAPSSSQGAL